jgi:hypothetical protein
MDKHYQLKIDNRTFAIAISLNDIELHVDRDNRIPHFELPVNHWIYDGTNRLHANLSIGPDMEELPDTFEFSAAIYECIRQGETLPQNPVL